MSRGKKFNNRKVFKGQTFDSSSEYKRFTYLKQLQDRNMISDLQTQVTFPLKRNRKYIADFTYEYKNKYIVEDVKNPVLRHGQVFRSKEKSVKNIYGLKIHIVPPCKVFVF